MPKNANRRSKTADMHLYVDISAHGLGHLAIVAPVLNRLAEITPNLRLTVASGLPATRLRERIAPPFRHLAEASDFGFVMHDATRIDLGASASAYREAHRDWPDRVADAAQKLRILQPDVVLTSVAYLPLAAAQQAGIPALALCSLHWGDLFRHCFGSEPWSGTIAAEIDAAYAGCQAFLRTTPGMPMPTLPRVVDIGVIAARGQRQPLGLGQTRCALVAMGGIQHRLPVEDWPIDSGWRWLVPEAWQVCHPDAVAYDRLNLSFTDLLCSVDAVITKPGYGTFTEATCNGTPILYQRREDWPEQDCLIDWLADNGNAREIAVDRLHQGDFLADLDALRTAPVRPPPRIDGPQRATQAILAAARAQSVMASAAGA